MVMDEPRCEFAEWKDWLLAGDDIRVVFEFSGVFFFVCQVIMPGIEYPITMYLLLYIRLMSLEAQAVNQMDFFFNSSPAEIFVLTPLLLLKTKGVAQ